MVVGLYLDGLNTLSDTAIEAFGSAKANHVVLSDDIDEAIEALSKKEGEIDCESPKDLRKDFSQITRLLMWIVIVRRTIANLLIMMDLGKRKCQRKRF